MYLIVIVDIIKNYSYILDKNELEYLHEVINKNINDNNINIKIINNILSKIWNDTLTSVFDYATGCNFCYLVKLKDMVVEDNKAFDTNKSKIKLITESNMLDLSMDSFGYIIKLDYNDLSTMPLLPIYFNNKNSIIVDKLNYKIDAMFVMDTKLKSIDTIYMYAKEESNVLKVPLLLFNKMYYRNKLNLSSLKNIDLDTIALIFFIEYTELNKDTIFKNGIGKDLLIKDKLVHKLLLDYYDNKIDINNLQSKIYERFKVIELDLLSNKKINY